MNFISVLALLPLLTGCTKNTSKKKFTVQESITINAPLKNVWKYNADDKNAKNWSAFFAKIAPCPESSCPQNKNKLPGEVGSVRRSYRNQNEKGIFWDEVTIESSLKKQEAYRKIISYNFNGYHSSLLKNKLEVVVEQFYELTPLNKTKLTFSAKLREIDKLTSNNDETSKNDTSYLDEKTLFIVFKNITGPRIGELFKKNLENIKAAIELGDKYQRVHPYQKFCDSKKWYCPVFLEDF